MTESVTVESDGEIALVTLRRPERRNALDAATARSVAEAVRAAARSHRVIIVTGEGAAFCAGGDLDELREWATLPQEDIATELYGSFQEMIRTIRDVDSVVIAAVNGPAVGAGMDLALACDLRVASDDARFGQVWVRLGVIPGTGGAYLTQALAGAGRAAELLLTGKVIGAAEALAAGLVNRVVAPSELVDAARDLARQILAHPRDGVVANKRAYVEATRPALEHALEHARRVQPGRFTSDEFKAAVERPPPR